MKLLLSLVSCVFIAYGCKPVDRSQSEEGRALIEVGGSTPQDPNKLPNKCGELLEFKRSYDAHGLSTAVPIATKEYKYNRCVRIFVGTYEGAQRVGMRGQNAMGSVLSKGNFELATQFMNAKGISCKEVNHRFTLTFPVHADDKDKKYETIEISCPDVDDGRVTVSIGVFSKRNKNKMAVTVASSIDDDHYEGGTQRYYDAFDTNRNGEIVKHIEVKGGGGREKNIMRRY